MSREEIWRVASPVELLLEYRPQSVSCPRGEAADDGLLLEEFGDVRRDELPFELDQRLVALCRERGPLRAALARIAARLVGQCAWERLGYARLSDYATERLGLSASSVQSLARVGWRLGASPHLEDALVSGTLGWTKVRLLAALPLHPNRPEDEEAWIAHARLVSAEELSKEVRVMDRSSIEAGGIDQASARGDVFEAPCTAEVRGKWDLAREAASRAAGRVLHRGEAAELIAAEVLSALPIDEQADERRGEDEGVSWSQERERTEETAGPEPSEAGPVSGDGAAGAEASLHPPWRSNGPQPPRSIWDAGRPPYPLALKPLLEGLGEADAFSLDERLRRAVSMEQRFEARIGPLLAPAWKRSVHRALGYTTREAYARERLGMDPTRARSLVRLEGAAVHSDPFARAYRSGALSWVKASALVPLVSADPLGSFVGDWVDWAGQVTVRRLREDVEGALALSETDRDAFRRGGGLPPEARDDREIGAASKKAEGPVAGADPSVEEANREIGAAPAPEENCQARFFGPADVVRLFKALLCTVRRRMERDEGRLPTEGEALGVMLDHVLSTWGELDGKIAARHKVFARDGWRCTVPGCTSMQNLHDHHIHFRSAGGSDALENRTTLCAFHHLRGVHAGLLRCVGRAPHGLRWEMGIRPGVTPLLAYRSGDRRVPAMGP